MTEKKEEVRSGYSSRGERRGSKIRIQQPSRDESNRTGEGSAKEAVSALGIGKVGIELDGLELAMRGYYRWLEERACMLSNLIMERCGLEAEG